MEIARSIRHIERRLQIHVQSRVSQRRQVDQRSLAVGGLQSQRQVYGNRGRPVSALCIEHREYFSPQAFLPVAPLCGTEADKCFEKIGGCGRAFDVFASPGAHRVDDDLGLL